MNFWRPASSADCVWFPCTMGLRGSGVQVVGPEQNLEHPHTSVHGHGDAGCQEGASQPQGKDQQLRLLPHSSGV